MSEDELNRLADKIADRLRPRQDVHFYGAGYYWTPSTVQDIRDHFRMHPWVN